MERDECLFLFSRKLTNEISRDEELDLEVHLANSKEDDRILSEVEKFYHAIPPRETEKKNSVDHIWRKIEEVEGPQGLNRGKRNIKSGLMIGIAASILVFVLVRTVQTYFPYSSFKTSIMHDSGKFKEYIALNDGTTVTMNPSSSLSFSSSFGIKDRNLEFEGKGYFNVSKNEKIPMEISMGNWGIRVLGTSFSIDRTLEKGDNSLILYSGKVEFFCLGSPHKSIGVKPGQRVRWKEGNLLGDLVIDSIDSEEIIVSQLWMKDSIVFKNIRFIDLKQKIKERYGFEIIFEDRSLMEKRFTGSFQGLEIRKLLEILQLTYPFRYKFKDDQIIIY